MITKRSVILRSSYFCEKYNINGLWDLFRREIGVFRHTFLSVCLSCPCDLEYNIVASVGGKGTILGSLKTRIPRHTLVI